MSGRLVRPVYWLAAALLLTPVLGSTATGEPGPAVSGGEVAASVGSAIEDGFYAVYRDVPVPQNSLRLDPRQRVLLYDHRFQSEADREPSIYLVVSSRPDVPLFLASPPRSTQDESGALRIGLELAPSCRDSAASFTRRMQGGRVAIVIGGQVVTVHKIRAVITDGRIQISCCSPGACEFLIQQLQTRLARG